MFAAAAPYLYAVVVGVFRTIVENPEFDLPPSLLREPRVTVHIRLRYLLAQHAADKAHIRAVPVVRGGERAIHIKVDDGAPRRAADGLPHNGGDPRRPRDMRTGRAAHYGPDDVVKDTCRHSVHHSISSY